MPANVPRQSAALALGGGGARGVAHLGVVEVLRKSPIDIQHYVGVSIGSLASALCAVESDTQLIQQNVCDYLLSDAFQKKQAAFFATAPDADEPGMSGLFAWYRQLVKYLGVRRKLSMLFAKPALLADEVLRDIVDALLPDIDIKDTPTPVTIVALDLYSGKPVLLTEGSLRNAVMASAAIPGVFPPIEWEDKLLCDIGMIDAVPTAVAKSYGADLTIAVEVPGQLDPIDECRTAASIFLRLYDVAEPLVRQYTQDLADLVIRPDVGSTPWYDFSNPAGLVETGREATEKYLIQRAEAAGQS